MLELIGLASWQQAGVFAVAVLLLNATPGVDLLLTVTRTLAGGARAGLAAAAGIELGCVVHALAAAFGLAALLAVNPAAFTVLKWAGAAYLVWLAVGMARMRRRRYEPYHVLAQLDVVVASIHSGLRQERETITARCLKVVENPHVDILGHPTGRLIGQRPPSELDVERILQACAANGTVVEINAHPNRLDLSDVYARRAVELGCKIAINSDAHSVDGMHIMPYGIATARRSWISAADVINTRPVAEMLALLKRS